MKYRKVLVAVVFGVIFSVPALSQNIDSLENAVRTTYGISKLRILNILTGHFQDEGSRKALRYGRQAVTIGENLFVESNSGNYEDIGELTEAYFLLGRVLYDREDYLSAREYFKSAKSMEDETGQSIFGSEIDQYLTDIQDKIDSGEVKENFFTRNFGDLRIGEAIRESSREVKIKSEIGLARMYESRQEYNSAIEHYSNAIDMLKDKGDARYIAELRMKVGVLYDSLQEYEVAQEYLSDAIVEADSIEKVNTLVNQESLSSEGKASLQDSLKAAQESLRNLSEQFAAEEDYERSLQYFDLYQQLTAKMEADSMQMADLAQRQDAQLESLKQQKNIADLKVRTAQLQQEQERKERNAYLTIALLVLLSALIILYFYMTKRKQHRDLTVAYSDLNETKGKLEGAEKRIVKLLQQQVSGGVAQALLAREGEHPVARKFVCVMFLDIRDFTPMAEQLDPEELIAFQNRIFGFMIDAVEKNHGTVNQLLGDGFMATFGAPESHGNDCQNGYWAAMDILNELDRRNKEGILNDVRIGIGLHAGHVVTGNVGNDARKQYSVTGNPVITASRVEQLNKEYHTQLLITREVYDRLDSSNELPSEFLSVQVKGRTEPVKILKIA